MRLQTRPFPNLCDADIIPYYWKPKVWVTLQRAWWDKNRILGVDGRLGPLGFAINFRTMGQFRNGSHWIILFRYRPEIEEMLF